ncbi:hypothetical protein [Bradyrhizobium sp. LMG 9283]|uniref:hypothetical protein n=1 Tax=Bradyrhizobium sp. LMG 9283 TaxID=592064 RepID=UPI00388DE4A5
MRSSSAAMAPVDGNGRDAPVANMVSNKIHQKDGNFFRDPGTRAVQPMPALHIATRIAVAGSKLLDQND